MTSYTKKLSQRLDVIIEHKCKTSCGARSRRKNKKRTRRADESKSIYKFGGHAVSREIQSRYPYQYRPLDGLL